MHIDLLQIVLLVIISHYCQKIKLKFSCYLVLFDQI